MKDDDAGKGKGYDAARTIGLAVTIPGMLFGCMIVGCLLGYYLDRWLHTSPWLFLVCLVLGMIAGVREMMVLLRKINNDKDS